MPLDLADMVRRKVTRDGVGSLLTSVPQFAERYLLVHHVAGEVRGDDLGTGTSGGGGHWEFGPDETVHIDYDGPQELPAAFEGMLGTYEVGQSFVTEVPDATLVGFPHPLSMTHDNRILKEAAGTTTAVHHRVKNLLETHGLRAVAREFTDGTGIPRADATEEYDFDTVFPLVSSSGQQGYYHWILEDLPCLRGYFQYRRETDRDPTVLIRPDPPSWVTESLELLGVSAADWREWDREKARVRRLVVPRCRFKAVPFEPSTAELQWLGQVMRTNAVDEADGPPDERIYVSREQARSRAVRNREEVLAELSGLGFESYVLEELSVPEQVRLFARAEVVVAPHGAGLTNLVFAPDPLVVELMPERDVRPWFFAMASQLGLDHRWLLCDHDTVDNEMWADTDALRDLLAGEGVTERPGSTARTDDARADPAGEGDVSG